MFLKKTEGYIYLILTFVAWGSLYIASKFALNSFSPYLMVFFRYFISVVLLYFIARKKGIKKIKKEHIKYFMIIGGLGYFAAIECQFISTELLDASLSSLMNSLSPVVMPITALILLGERINKRVGLGITLSVIGVYVILGVGGVTDINITGIIFGIFSTVLWTVNSCYIRKVSDEYDPIQIALYGMAIALCFATPAAVVSLKFAPIQFHASSIPAVLYIAVFCTAFSNVSWNKSLQALNATTCAMFYPLQPTISAILGIILLGEKLTLSFVIGAVIICMGILCAVTSQSGAKRARRLKV